MAAARGGGRETGAASSATLAKSLQPSESQFLHLKNGGDDTYSEMEHVRSKWDEAWKPPVRAQ